MEVVVRRKRRAKLAIEPIEGGAFERFIEATNLQQAIIQTKRTSNMTAKGKKASMSVLVVVGNGAGAAGWAFGTGTEMKTAFDKAVLRAYRTMIPIKLLDGHTLHHKAVAHCRATRVFARPGRPGKGLVCHKFIATICKVAGVKDLSADVIGRGNPMSIVRATFEIFRQQKSVLDIAKEQGKTVLEYRHLDKPPVILGRHGQSPEELARQQASKDTVEWLRSFPVKPSLENFLLARNLLQSQGGLTHDAGLYDPMKPFRRLQSLPSNPLHAASRVSRRKQKAATVRQWLKTIPATVCFQHTVFEGVALPPAIRSL